MHFSFVYSVFVVALYSLGLTNAKAVFAHYMVPPK